MEYIKLMSRNHLHKIIPMIFWIGFLLCVVLVSYPTSIVDASLKQLVAFFIPLLFALIFTFHLLIKSYYRCFVLAFGVILLLLLQAFDTLNLVTLILTSFGVALLMGNLKLDFLKKKTKTGLKKFT